MDETADSDGLNIWNKETIILLDLSYNAFNCIKGLYRTYAPDVLICQMNRYAMFGRDAALPVSPKITTIKPYSGASRLSSPVAPSISPFFLFSFFFCLRPPALGRISGSPPSHTHLRLQTKGDDAMRYSDVIFPLSLAVATVSAGVVDRRAAFTLQNGLDAQDLNRKFESLTPGSACTEGESACVNGQLAQCASGKFVLFSCAAPLQCVALPLVNKPGTRYVCRWGRLWEGEVER